ncbi:FixH family protein [Chryseobacterium sp. A301]
MLKNFTWGHGVVVALGAFMIFILSLVFIYGRGWQNAEMVSRDYYEDELRYQEVIDAKNKADLLTEKPIYNQNSQGITLEFPASISVDQNSVNFHLFRTDDANLDVEKDLQFQSGRKIHIPKQILFPGSYTLKIAWKSKTVPYQVDYDVLWK